MEVELIFVLVRVVICLAFFGYASWSDLKKREVSNLVWLFFLPIAFAATATELLYFGSMDSWITYGFSFLITTSMALALFYTGAYGGADAKALICLAVAIPFYPSNVFKPLFGESLIPFPITVFINSVLLAALIAPYMLLHNLLWKVKNRRKLFSGLEKEPLWRKVLVLICGYKVSCEKLKEKPFLFPLEDVEGDGLKRKLVIFVRDEGRDEVVKRLLSNIRNEESGEVWVTPGLPMLVFITLGIIIGLFFENIVWDILILLLG